MKVSQSGVRLLERAISVGFKPSPVSCGPARYLKLYKRWRAGK